MSQLVEERGNPRFSDHFDNIYFLPGGAKERTMPESWRFPGDEGGKTFKKYLRRMGGKADF